MLEVELIGAGEVPGAPDDARTAQLVRLAVSSVGIDDGHVAVQYVDAERIAELNAEHRGKEGPTDVLSFPIDELDDLPEAGPDRELGDVVICAPHTEDLEEAIVHGALHLVGMDHETDDGEMLALQADLLRQAGATT
jgi:probable rRNA maturation factor